FSTADLAPGTHDIQAAYTGDSNFATSSGTLQQTVNQAATTTTLASSTNPSVFGQSVTFTATVAATVPGAGTPTGSVVFVDFTTSTALGTGTLDAGGVATLSIADLAPGTHDIQATYTGDSNFTTSNGSVSQA